MAAIIDSFAEISDRYDAAFVDLWGCVHNGKKPFEGAITALRGFVDRGGHVVLLTNAPRPDVSVRAQLDAMGVPREIWHVITTSGDSAKAALGSGAYGTRVHHIGPERDLTFFAPTEETPGLADIALVPLDQAQSVVCTGLVDDETETPQDYAALLLEAKTRGLEMLCANPDIVVDHGSKRKYCAGALALDYRERGGVVHYFGKPHPPIYDLARNRLTAVAGRVVPDARIICIGDGILTDIPGAQGEGLDSLFISGGLAAVETATQRSPDPERLEAFLQAHDMAPTFTIGHLR